MKHLGRSGIAKNPINAKKVKCDGPTDQRTDGPMDGRTDGPTKRGAESRSTRLKKANYGGDTQEEVKSFARANEHT